MTSNTAGAVPVQPRFLVTGVALPIIPTLRAVIGATFSFEFPLVLFIHSGLYKESALASRIPFDLTLLFALLTVLSGLLVVMRTRGEIPQRSLTAVLVFGAFFIYALGSVAWAPLGGVSTDRAFRYLPLTALAFLGGAAIVSRDAVRVRRFLGWQLVVSGYALAVTLAALGGGAASAADLEFELSSYISRGMAMAIGAVTALAFGSHARGRFGRLLLTAGMVAMFTVGVLASGSRQALLALVLALFAAILSFFHYREIGGFAFSRRGHIILVVGLLAALGLPKVLQSDLTFATLDRLQIILEGRTGESLEVRSEFRQRALAAIPDAPLLGHGIGSFGVLFGNQPEDHPHNMAVEIAFELGVLGLALTGALLFCVFRKAHLFANARRDPVAMAIMLILVALGASAMISNSFAEARSLFASLGLALYRPSPGYNTTNRTTSLPRPS